MPGRKPRCLNIAAPDLPILQAVARARHLAFYQVQHARIVLAVAAGEPVHSVASRMECDPATAWRVCRRYEQGGLSALLADGRRSRSAASPGPGGGLPRAAPGDPVFRNRAPGCAV